LFEVQRMKCGEPKMNAFYPVAAFLKVARSRFAPGATEVEV
jgi:hypothetical protein